MHKRTKATAIPPNVKIAVAERDGFRCLWCSVHCEAGNAHFIRRSRGGLGIEENLLTLCAICHDKYDRSPQNDTGELWRFFRKHLQGQYPGWDASKLIYRKGA